MSYSEMERQSLLLDKLITKQENDKHHDIGLLKGENNDPANKVETDIPR